MHLNGKKQLCEYNEKEVLITKYDSNKIILNRKLINVFLLIFTNKNSKIF